jgi:FKBP-type peptidyl-prolyl cis-trans isomerase SlyD
MTIHQNSVVTFHYTLSGEDGQTLETTREREPMLYLHGAGNIIPGLEKAMDGRSAGDSFSVTVAPEEAYGPRAPSKVQRVPAKHFPQPKKLKPGQVVRLNTRRGPMQAVVLKVGRFNIDIDVNHPLAGRTLTFDVEIVDVRDATPDEIAHRHAHGPGGAQH